MIGVGEAAIGFGILVVLLFIGLHVATAMFLVSVLGASLYLSAALVDSLGTQLWASMEDYVLLSIPLGLVTVMAADWLAAAFRKSKWVERVLNWSFAAIFTAFAATILTAQARH